MIFTCFSQDLNTALSIVTHAIPNRTPKPILEGVLLESCEEGLRFTCSDMMLTIVHVIPASFEEEGRVVLPGKFFYDMVRKLPNGECTLSIDIHLHVSVSCNAFRTSFSGLDPVEYPELPEVEGKGFALPMNRLRQLIGGTLFATAVDESRPILTGCLFEIGKARMNVVALDGFRLAMRTLDIEGPDVEEPLQAVLPGRSLNEMMKILEDVEDSVTFTINSSHAEFRFGQTLIVARRLEGEYIRYRQILPTSWETEVVIERRPLESAIDRAGLIAREGRSNLVLFTIEGGELKVSSNSETSNMEERVPVETQGKDLTIAFNVRYVNDVLRAMGEDKGIMRFNSPVSPCVISPMEGDAYLYLVLPVRIFNQSTR